MCAWAAAQSAADGAHGADRDGFVRSLCRAAKAAAPSMSPQPLATVALALTRLSADASKPLSDWLNTASNYQRNYASNDRYKFGQWAKTAPLCGGKGPLLYGFGVVLPLTAPRAKFLVSSLLRIALAAALCVLPPPDAAPWGATTALGTLWQPLGRRCKDRVAFRFNRENSERADQAGTRARMGL